MVSIAEFVWFLGWVFWCFCCCCGLFVFVYFGGFGGMGIHIYVFYDAVIIVKCVVNKYKYIMFSIMEINS